MNTNMQDYITHSNTREWAPLIEKGVHYAGIFVKSLRYDAASGRSKTILLRFEPGAKYPYHNHPAGEEIFVLEGEATLEGATLRAGDYLYTPPGFKHSVFSKTGCTLFFVIPEEVELLDEPLNKAD
ncbi:ChrR Cupin-like domain-containing protein [Chitinophaga jiangningensis]|uniref:ChrR Cupin-like domain-containing protein n=1 Tax=Chitinophaga jiangningensis TaxID=1419482 RepID=A0A1M7MUU4_9BACT|nr:cupin domain-containing protein [Chitinophaga jiangningensis]SHM94922.1 ChrR Cupin-like domain-containing protein [Chitinophaga jiangningensis]